MLMLKYVKVYSLIIALAFSTGMGAAFAQQSPPPISGVDINGKHFSLNELKGRVVLLNFWATWCEACMEEMSTFKSFYYAHRKDGFVVVAINVDDAEDEPKAIAVAKKLPFVVALQKNVSMSGYGSMHALPYNLIIGRDGKIHAGIVGCGLFKTFASSRKCGIGEYSESELRKVIDPLLASHG